jgi:hypothetical protein
MDQRSDPERDGVVEGYARARAELHDLLAGSSVDELKARSSGTRWTNEQLLFHMVFGYMIVRALLPLVRVFSRLPPRVSRGFAGILNAGTRPFDVVNYWGSRWGARVFNRTRMEAQMDRTLRALIRSRDKETTDSLRHGMAFPTRWDLFFRTSMTIAEIYAYPTQHFNFHRQQLGLVEGH